MFSRLAPKRSSDSLPLQPLGDFRVNSRVLLLMAMAPVVGAFGVAAAWALVNLIALATNLAWYGEWSFVVRRVADSPIGVTGVLIPALGGLIIGLMARFGSEKIRGHGIPEAIEAILIGGSRIQPKVAVLKPLSSAISIGTGGPFGAEGPIIMTGGALGSLFAQLFHLTSAERKTLLVAGAAAGMTGVFGTPVAAMLVYGTEDVFSKVPLHWMWWPAIGGLIVGIGGLLAPEALGVGYDLISGMLNDRFTIHALLVLVAVKAVVWAVALGSGTSGGVLAPLLIIGGALGALAGAVLSPDHIAFCSLLGMAAMMGGTMRSPLTATIFACELTGNTHALLPLIAACTAAHAVTVLILNRSILTERIARRGLHISREYTVDPFEVTRVRDVMIRSVDTLPAQMTIADAVNFFTGDVRRHKSYPVVDESGALAGIVSRADILRWMVEHKDSAATLATKIENREPLLVGYADEFVGQLADRMARDDIGRVPIVDASNRVIGLVARKDLLHARARLLSHEHERTAPLRFV